ncbi:hypothetical protein BP5796_08113 [Coleophoma crateriformis]|uniref:S5 DRBM domain-containing protein n=1 Tax=Coleophoma crateriformis TaxID=565419 RepID=A0A3D8RDF1_9HELO|nr:hypothetical protein BP5796_08113 [Coleophoma crateriformis]
MSVSRPARCLLSTPSIPTVRPRIRCQNFHASSKLHARRRPRVASLKAGEMGLLTNQLPAKEIYKPYSEREKIAVERQYAPEQLEAIEAGEAAIDPEHLKSQGQMRTDLGSLPYLDDLSQNAMFVDSKIEKKGARDSSERMMTPDEYGEHLANYMTKTGSHIRAGQRRSWELEEYWTRDKKPCFHCGQPGHSELSCPNNAISKAEREDLISWWETKGRAQAMQKVDVLNPVYRRMERQVDEANTADAMRAYKGFTGWIGSKGPIIDDPSTSVGSATALAPKLPTKIDTDEIARIARGEVKKVDPRDPEGQWDKLREETGMSLNEILDLKTNSLVTNYVSNQTRLGKVKSLYVLTIAGDGKGRLGLGEAKGAENEETRHNSRMDAIRKMRPIPRYEDRTIYGQVDAKVAATEVTLMARPPGFGLRCQHLIFEMCRAAGIHDLAARVPRSRNKMNTVKAAYHALMNQRIPDEIARGRGIKLVDVRKVYYGGRV